MPLLCPTCSRVNPADATYCYYDGRGLNKTALAGPLGSGTTPFPMPFCFADGHGCTTFNQLVLACDQHWNEARTYLVNGTWQTFFGSIGRIDLAILAQQSAAHPDPDLGLCQLLERLPADADALRLPRLTVPSTEEDLGTLEPGKDHKLPLVLANEGMLLLRGSATTDCDWLALGGIHESGTSKLFQTRDTYTLPVRVIGSKLRAAKQPLEGHIHIETNGGRQTLTVRASVPIRPFPAGPAGDNVLTGALSSREIALKAKAHPQEAAALFEQGAVRAWYQSNGWGYPIRGTQALGKSALQQFFEALGLTRPPRLEIDTERIECQGAVGQHLTKKVTLRTAESRFVHAEAHSNQEWIKALPGVSQGNSFTIPLRIEVPPCVGATLQAAVTFCGNGQQQFVVPVALTVTAKTPRQEAEDRARRRLWLTWGISGVVVAIALIIAIRLILDHRSRQENPNPEGTAQEQKAEPAEKPIKRWWDGIADTHLTATVTELKKAAAENRAIFELIEGMSESDRRKGYEQLAARLPELAGKPALQKPLGLFVTECCVYEPSEFNIIPLLRSLVQQAPEEERSFPPGDNGAAVERAVFAVRVIGDVVAHKATPRDRSRSLAGDLASVFGPGFNSRVPPQEFKEQAEKALAKQCYHNLVPTAESSLEQALALRAVLIARFPQLDPELRAWQDVRLLTVGLKGNKQMWPKLEPLFKACMESKKLNVGNKLLDLYAKADAELALKMEALLALRWEAAGNARLTQAEKVEALRASMKARAEAAKLSPEERLKQLQEVLADNPVLKREQMDELVPLLRHDDPKVVLLGLKAVAASKEEAAQLAGTVAGLLAHDSAPVRAAAVTALEALGPAADQKLPRLTQLLLARFPLEKAATVRKVLADVLHARLVELKQEQRKELLPLLHHKDAGLVMVALKVLQARKEEMLDLAGEVLGLLKNEDAAVRVAALATLKAFGADVGKELPRLTRQLLDHWPREKDAAVRKALAALLRVRLALLKQEQMKELLPLLRHGDAALVVVALKVVLARKEEAGDLAEEVAGLLGHPTASVRVAAGAALEALGSTTEKALPNFSLLLDRWTVEQDAAVRRILARLLRARLALLKRGQMKELVPLLGHKDEELVLVALKVVEDRKKEAKDVAAEVGNLLKHSSAQVRTASLDALKALGTAAEKALPKVFELLDEKPRYQRTRLALTVAGMVDTTDSKHIERLVPFLLEGLHPQAQNAQEAASEDDINSALVKIGQPSVDGCFTSLNGIFALEFPGVDNINYRKKLYETLVKLAPTCRSEANLEMTRSFLKKEYTKKHKDVIAAAGAAVVAMQAGR